MLVAIWSPYAIVNISDTFKGVIVINMHVLSIYVPISEYLALTFDKKYSKELEFNISSSVRVYK